MAWVLDTFLCCSAIVNNRWFHRHYCHTGFALSSVLVKGRGRSVNEYRASDTLGQGLSTKKNVLYMVDERVSIQLYQVIKYVYVYGCVFVYHHSWVLSIDCSIVHIVNLNTCSGCYPPPKDFMVFLQTSYAAFDGVMGPSWGFYTRSQGRLTPDS